MALTKREKRIRIRKRIRKTVKGTSTRPRLSVFRSNKAIYCQVINDLDGTTLVAASSKESGISGSTKTEVAKAVGKLIAEKAKSAKVQEVIFDRSGYLFHGRVKALAEGAREGGLQF